MAHHTVGDFPRRLIRRLRFVELLIALIICSNGAAARSLDEIERHGVIRIGVNTTAAPRSFYADGGQLRGFDIDIGLRIAKKLGVKPLFVPTLVGDRMPFLNSDRTDISLGALTRTPDREKVIDFTIALNTDTIGVLTTDRLKITSWRELNDPAITIVDVRGYSSVPLISKTFPRARLLLLDGDEQVIRALAEGRADALVEDIAAYVLVTKRYPHIRWRTLREPVQIGYCAVGVSKGNHALRVELNRILAEMHRSGYIDYEWKKWYSWPMQGTIDVDAELAAADSAHSEGD